MDAPLKKTVEEWLNDPKFSDLVDGQSERDRRKLSMFGELVDALCVAASFPPPSHDRSQRFESLLARAKALLT